MAALASKNEKAQRIFVGGTEIPRSLRQARMAVRIYHEEQDKANGCNTEKNKDRTPKE